MAIAQKEAKSSESNAVLLTPQQLSEKLNVPTSWIREKTRQRARARDDDPLPVIRLGKYTRFRLSDIEAWLQRQSEVRDGR
jgi:predicted DNA-binding transcriptional regulator AlpA